MSQNASPRPGSVCGDASAPARGRVGMGGGRQLSLERGRASVWRFADSQATLTLERQHCQRGFEYSQQAVVHGCLGGPQITRRDERVWDRGPASPSGRCTGVAICAGFARGVWFRMTSAYRSRVVSVPIGLSTSLPTAMCRSTARPTRNRFRQRWPFRAALPTGLGTRRLKDEAIRTNALDPIDRATGIREMQVASWYSSGIFEGTHRLRRTRPRETLGGRERCRPGYWWLSMSPRRYTSELSWDSRSLRFDGGPPASARTDNAPSR